MRPDAVRRVGSTRIRLGALAAAGAVLIFVGAFAAPAAAHGDVPWVRATPPEEPAGSSNSGQTSLDWAGYAAIGPTFSKVSGSWVQPAASCPTKKVEQSAFWVGLDGFGAKNDTVEQIGTDADCGKGTGKGKGGTPSYYAWFELYPAVAVTLSKTTFPVAPGDSMSATVSVAGSIYTLTLYDAAKWTYTTMQASTGHPADSSAEWIAESPSTCNAGKCKVGKLADFGTVDFTGASADSLPISSPGYTHTEIVMTNKGATETKAEPLTLTAGGTAFSVVWKHN
ncbi:MAG: G1 family glutamic endopeptidase [Acidimicrobiales bacterium]